MNKKTEEKATREWLKSLNFAITHTQENESLLKNPLRNGVLLCEVLLSYSNISSRS
jgi:hypothetical protein